MTLVATSIAVGTQAPSLSFVSCIVLGALLAMPAHAAEGPDDSPHWNKSACSACHNSTAPTNRSDLKLRDHSALCQDCHDAAKPSHCPHPNKLPANDLGQFALPGSYRSALVNEDIVCTSCHDLTMQCTGSSRDKYQNPSFLRDGPFHNAADVCLVCHDSAYYEKLNPHTPVSADSKETCLFCHHTVPDKPDSGPGLRLSGNLQCIGCHAVAPHPLSMAPGAGMDEWTHLVVPAIEIVDRMNASMAQTGIELPLDTANGAIFCATCHDPHDADPLKTADDPPDRLRMSDICEACHDK